MTKFVKKFNIFVALLIVAFVMVGCNNNNQEEIKITIDGLQESYTFNTGDEFSEDILLQGVTVTDQNGKSYIENVEIKGIQAIPLNDDGTLKQAGKHTLRLNVVIDGKTVSTKMITVEVIFQMVETNDIIYNGDFETGTVDPFVITGYDGGVATMEVVNGELVLSITSLSWQAGSPRLDYGAVDSESRFSLEDGKYYEVQFDARASVARDIHVQIGQLFNADPWFADALPVQQYFSLTTEMKSYSFRFQADASRADLSVLSLLFGHGTLPSPYTSVACDVVYDNIKIVEVDSLGADTTAPSISASDKSVYVGTVLDIMSLVTVSDDQDKNPQVTAAITKDGVAVDAVDTSAPGVYNITYTAKDVAGNEATKSIVLTIKEKPTTAVQIENGNEADSATNGGWIEWHDQGWCGSTVAVSEALVGPDQLKLSYSYVDGGCWYGMQLFYTDSAIAAGPISIIMDINASAAGKVTIAGQVVELVAGDNHLEIAGNTSSTGATLSMQFGILEGETFISGGSFVVSNLIINEVVVIGEGAEVPGFDLGFIEEAGAIANPGTIGYWNDQWWCGSNVTVSQAKYAAGTLTISYEMEGFCSWALQIFLDDASVAVGEQKTVTMKIVADEAGAIQVSGNVVNLVVGENNIEVVATKAANKALLQIIFGDPGANTHIAGGTFIISECNIFDVIVPPTEKEEEEKVEIPAEGLLSNDLSAWYQGVDKVEVVEGKLVLTVNAETVANNYDKQFKLEKLTLDATKTYEVVLVVKSSIARKIQIMVQNNGSWEELNSRIEELPGGEEVEIRYSFVPAHTPGEVLFGLMLGKVANENPVGEHTLEISKVSLAETSGNVDSEIVEIPAEGLLPTDLAKWVAWADANQAIKAEVVEGKLVLTLNSTGATANYSPQFKIETANYVAGKTYKVEIVLTSSINRSIEVMLQEKDGSWAVVSSTVHALTAGEEAIISFEVTAGGTYSNAIFGLMLGAIADVATPEGEHTLTISKISLVEVEKEQEEQPGDAQVLPLIETGAKVEGAGVWLYFDNSVLNVQGGTEKVLVATATIDGNEVAVHDCFLSDWNVVAENSVRIYTVLGAAPIEGQVTVVKLSMTIAGVEYVATATFNGASLVSIA